MSPGRSSWWRNVSAAGEAEMSGLIVVQREEYPRKMLGPVGAERRASSDALRERWKRSIMPLDCG